MYVVHLPNPERVSGAYFDRFDIVQAHYWWSVDHHGGQGCELYAKHCRLAKIYRPAPREHGPYTANAAKIYGQLCEAEGCDHQTREEK